MNQDIEELYRRVTELQKIVKNLLGSSTIPRNVETAFIERLGLTNIANAVDGAGVTTANTQNISIPSTPTTITVPAQPAGALTVTYKGSTYNLLYK